MRSTTSRTAMTLHGTAGRLLEWSAARGYATAWGPATALSTARRALIALRDQGQLDPGFFGDQLDAIAAEPDSLPDWGRTAIVVAVPAPAATVAFATAKGAVTALLPPTYMRYRHTNDEVAADLAAAALGSQYRSELIRGPLKTLAARLGLVSWGRNNITYSREFGSYQQLVGVLTDACLEPRAEPGAAAAASLPECDGCSSCVSACPTAAIPDDRFLIHAERCLVAFNESPGPWPAWIPTQAHGCLIGCMACQEACPANAGLLRTIDSGVTFSDDETAALLSGEPGLGAPWHTIQQKLTRLGRGDDLAILGRNLRALLAYQP